MIVRHAKTPDAQTICDLVNRYAEQGRMLHRSLESLYADLRDFLVACDTDTVVGCAAVDIFWRDLAEIKSLAVSPDRHGQGIGRQLVRAAIDDARDLGVRKVFALTYEAEFFKTLGFAVIPRDTLPEKVWRECFACPKVDCCDEIAMLLTLD